MKKNALFANTFRIEEVDNGYILFLGREGDFLPSSGTNRFVFNSADDLKEFITDYILGDI